MLSLTSVTTKREALENRALHLATVSPNCDPADVIVARESAAERLADYLAHVDQNRNDRLALETAAAVVLDAFAERATFGVSRLGRVS